MTCTCSTYWHFPLRGLGFQNKPRPGGGDVTVRNGRKWRLSHAPWRLTVRKRAKVKLESKVHLLWRVNLTISDDISTSGGGKRTCNFRRCVSAASNKGALSSSVSDVKGDERHLSLKKLLCLPQNSPVLFSFTPPWQAPNRWSRGRVEGGREKERSVLSASHWFF